MFIAIIPARGNSKGILKKNISKIGGKSLVDWAIDCAVNSSVVDCVVLSTDDAEIVRNSETFSKSEKDFTNMLQGEVKKISNRIVIHKRRQIHAGENSKTIEGVLDILKSNLFCNEDEIVILQPTSPFRTSTELEKVKHSFTKHGAKSLISVRLFDSPHPAKAILLKNGLVDTPRFSLKNLSTPRQNLLEYYVSDGAYYMSTVKNIKSTKKFVSKNSQTYVRKGLSTINIDTMIDLQLSQLIYDNNLLID